MTLRLRLKQTSTVPIEVEGIVPERVRELSLAAIEKLEFFHGNRKLALAEFFDIAGDPADQRMEWEGNLSGVHWIGAKMSGGEIHISGHAGRHLGSEMSGGAIHVGGNAGDWVGGEMRRGWIHVAGSAGHLVGAAYRGSAKGMVGGTILIGGDAGNEIGHTMRRGQIVVGGGIGDLAAFNMLAGTLIVFGGCGIRHGAGMHRGTLAFFGEPPPLLPTFRRACRYRPPFMPLVFRQLEAAKFKISADAAEAELDLYHGDMIEGGRGEILLRA